MNPPVTVLVVEDEPLILWLVQSVLEAEGYEVIAVPHGREALLALEGERETLGALVTDIRLGADSPTGWEVARRARELRPHVAVIYVTGDSGHVWPTEGVAGSVLVTKPFVPAQIVDALTSLGCDAIQMP